MQFRGRARLFFLGQNCEQAVDDALIEMNIFFSFRTASAITLEIARIASRIIESKHQCQPKKECFVSKGNFSKAWAFSKA
jgi:hypothetical protein